jgi:hypothetical protein
LMGYELKLETLKNAKADEIKKIVESNIDGWIVNLSTFIFPCERLTDIIEKPCADAQGF